jgi:hypothetical protein
MCGHRTETEAPKALSEGDKILATVRKAAMEKQKRIQERRW